MKESLLKLAKLLAEDEKFLKEFSSKKSVDEQYNFAQKSVKGYTKDEFIKFLDELEKSYESKKDVLPEDLEKVSGGASAKTKAAAMAMLALTAAGGISNLVSMPVGASAMIRMDDEINISEELNDDKLTEYTYTSSSKGGSKRIAIQNKIKNLSYQKLEEFVDGIKKHYAQERIDTAWQRSRGLTWTG